jgi:thiamine phosphate synthase YjbQ (UPF0047 family)
LIKPIDNQVRGQSLQPIIDRARPLLANSGYPEGPCTLVMRHTSASLFVQENVDDIPADIESALPGTWYNVVQL